MPVEKKSCTGEKPAKRVSSMPGVLNILNLQQTAKLGVNIDPTLAEMRLVWRVTLERIATATGQIIGLSKTNRPKVHP
jgi:hypothetical protein